MPRSTQKRKITRTTKLDGRRLTAQERRLKVLELKRAFHTYREIGDRLGVSHTQIRRDFQKSIHDLTEKEIQETRELRALELERLDRIGRAVWPGATADDPDPEMVTRALKIIEQRCKLLGLDAPTKMEIDQTLSYEESIKRVRSNAEEIEAVLARRAESVGGNGTGGNGG